MSNNGLVLLPTSIGEAFDKLTILQLKKASISDQKKLAEINKEIDAINNVVGCYKDKIDFFYKHLLLVNQKIWIQCDLLREGTYLATSKQGEKQALNKEEYANCCVEIIQENDDRFRLKNKINQVLKSWLKEQKSYSLRWAVLNLNVDISNLTFFIGAIRFFSIRYDQVTILSEGKCFSEVKQWFSDDPSITVESVKDQQEAQQRVEALAKQGCKVFPSTGTRASSYESLGLTASIKDNYFHINAI